MNKNQWIAFGTAVVVILVIYLFGETRKPKSAAPAAPMAQDAAPAYDVKAYLQKVNAQLDKDTAALVAQLEAKPESWGQLAAIYRRKGESVAEAYYLSQYAAATHQLSDLNRAADLFSATAGLSENPALTTYLKQQALATYRQVVALDSSADNRIKLATAYLDEGSEPMQGVGMLLAIVRADSNNADAQLMLGKFGLVSRQYEKAVTRLEKVVYLRPRNPDALFLLANAYEGAGRPDKAIQALDQCLKLVGKPELKKEIEAYKAQIKAKGGNAPS
ncbi:MAG: tetratricopeptide repeat protein [Chitinophagales bacterium]